MGRDDIRRDAAGVGPDPRMAGRLYRLREFDGYKVASGSPDVRGWDVRTLSGTDIGEVEDLLIDPHREEVVMLDVDVHDSDQHVTIPVRGVQVDRKRHCVVVDSGDVRDARELRNADGNVDRASVIEEVVLRRRRVREDELDDIDDEDVSDERYS